MSTSTSTSPARTQQRRFGLSAKLAMIAVLPLVFLVIAGAVLFSGRLQEASTASAKSSLIGLGKDAETVVNAARTERAASAGGPRDAAPRALDSAINRLRASVGEASLPNGVVSDAWHRAEGQLNRLGEIRASAGGGGGAGLAGYTGLINSLHGFQRTAFGAGGGPEAAAVSGLNEAREELSNQYAVLLAGIGRGQLTQPESVTVRDSGVRMDAALERFRATASADELSTFERTVDQAELGKHSDLVDRAFKPGKITVSAGDWTNATQGLDEHLKQVAGGMSDRMVADASSSENDARTAATVTGILLLVAVLLAIAVAVFLGRRLVSAVRELRGQAREVAQRGLPSALADLRAGRQVSTEIEPMPTGGGAELGELASSFDAVHAEARALASAQANLRSNYGTVFVNLSRRSQTLVQRQLRLIEQLERDEEDPDQLGTLFALDHLATRMRRNNENLMVLSGAEPNRGQAAQPVPVEDLLRAAVSEIEQYRRVVLAPPPPATVLGYTAGDLVRLVAELLDNATAFSAPDTTVTVSTTQDAEDESLLIEVSDHGIGMRAEELATANERLASSSPDEVPASRRMGLFVVGRLADRQGVRVALRTGESDGLVAGIRIPRKLLASVSTPDGGLGIEHARPSPAEEKKEDADTVETVLPQPAQPYGAKRTDSGKRPSKPRPERTGQRPSGQAAQSQSSSSQQPPAAAERTGELPRRIPKQPPERTPIFDSMLSAWFADPGQAQDPFAAPGATEQAPEEQTQAAEAAGSSDRLAEDAADAAVLGGEGQRWRFAADEGWQAVEEVAEVQQDTFTEAGLPKRTPRARLLPGSVPDGAEQQQSEPTEPPVPKHSPDSVRSRLASFQRGLRRGRHSTGEEPPAQRASSDTELFAPKHQADPDAKPESGPEPENAAETTSWAFSLDDEPVRSGPPDPSAGGDTALTEAGLPKRTPKAQLVPGSPTDGAANGSPAGPNAAGVNTAPPDANGVRSRLASFQRGLSQGRRSVGIPERDADDDQHAYQWENE